MVYTKEQRREYTNQWRSTRKEEARSILGGKCVICGTEENLQFDHIDPETKLFSIASMWTASKDKFQTELSKCQLLCHEHHLEKSKNEGSLQKTPPREVRPYVHGTMRTYTEKKCRCQECQLAKKVSRIRKVKYSEVITRE